MPSCKSPTIFISVFISVCFSDSWWNHHVRIKDLTNVNRIYMIWRFLKCQLGSISHELESFSDNWYHCHLFLFLTIFYDICKLPAWLFFGGGGQIFDKYFIIKKIIEKAQCSGNCVWSPGSPDLCILQEPLNGRGFLSLQIVRWRFFVLCLWSNLLICLKLPFLVERRWST